MTRDYKRKRKTKPKKRGSSASDSSPWMFLASGFGLGLVAAFVLYMQMRPQEVVAPDRPIPNASVAPQSSIESEALEVKEESVAAVVATNTKPPVRTPTRVESDFDFYTELPGYEVVVADEDNQPVTAKSTRQSSKPSTETSGKPANYILQVGSFRKFIDADRQKAKLAFKGIESDIQPVVLKEDETWHRVYVGPTTDFASLQNMRSDLRRENIDSMLLRVQP
ncbi:MAG: SPOR domain-containing protein [Gammaproteobacteria bacterium]